MSTDPIRHRAVLTVTAVSRPDGGHYLNQADFVAHVTQWVKTDLKDHHAIAEVTTSDQAAPPAAVPPTDQAGLRELIAGLFRHPPGVERLGDATPGEIADAVLSVLPADSEPHRLALSEALGLGTSAPWDAIRVRAAELAGQDGAGDREAEAEQTTEPKPETPLEKRLRYSERRNDELRTECLRRGRNVLEQSEKNRALERQIDSIREQLGAEILRAGEAEAELRRLAAETPGPETQARRGDEFERWLKVQRDEYEVRSSPQWGALDEVLDTYRLHADTGTPLGEHVCEGQAVGDCDCLETPAAFEADLASKTSPKAASKAEVPPVCEGFQWIGQSFATCDRCGQPAWDHEGEEVAVEGAGPFDTRRTVRPWKPGEADAIRAKWGTSTPPAAVAEPGKEADTGPRCGSSHRFEHHGIARCERPPQHVASHLGHANDGTLCEWPAVTPTNEEA